MLTEGEQRKLNSLIGTKERLSTEISKVNEYLSRSDIDPKIRQYYINARKNIAGKLGKLNNAISSLKVKEAMPTYTKKQKFKRAGAKAWGGVKRYGPGVAKTGGVIAAGAVGAVAGAGAAAVGAGASKVKNAFSGSVDEGRLNMVFIIAFFVYFYDTFILKYERTGAYFNFSLLLYLGLAVVAAAMLRGEGIKSLLQNLFKFTLLSAIPFYIPVLIRTQANAFFIQYGTVLLLFTPAWIMYLFYFSQGQSKLVKKMASGYLIFWFLYFTIFYSNNLYGYIGGGGAGNLDVMTPVREITKNTGQMVSDAWLSYTCSVKTSSQGVLFAETDCTRLEKAKSEAAQVTAVVANPTLKFELIAPTYRPDFVSGQEARFRELGIKNVVNNLDEKDSVKIEFGCDILDSSILMKTSSNTQKTYTITSAERQRVYTYSCDSQETLKRGSYILQFSAKASALKSSSSLDFLVVSRTTLENLIENEIGDENTRIKKVFSGNQLVEDASSSGPISRSSEDFVRITLELTKDYGGKVVYGIEKGDVLLLKIILRNTDNGRIENVDSLKITMPAEFKITDKDFDDNGNFKGQIPYKDKIKDQSIILGPFDVSVVSDLTGMAVNLPDKKSIAAEFIYDYNIKRNIDFVVS